jgi:cobalt transporter subunit CbtA
LLGGAGFLCFTLAPSFGLPPELPGTQAADLGARQLWWVATVAATAGGLGLLFWVRRPSAAVAAVALLALPHLVGAPQPELHASLAPQGLTRAFIATALATSLAFWLVLGSAAGFLYERFAAKPA